jgi:phage shock protein A
MWGNLFKGKKKEDEPLDPAEMVSQAIVEMEDAIRKSNSSLGDIKKSYQENAEKLLFYQQNSEDLQRKAMQAVKKNKEAEAKQILVQKANNEQHIKHYQGLCNSMNDTLLKLEGQVVKMKMQLDETKAKKLMLTAQLSNAQNQKDLADKMKELNLSTDAFEAKIFQTEAENVSADDALEKEFEALENFKSPEIEAMKQEAQEEERKIKELEQANKDKKIAMLLGSTVEKEKKNQQQQEQKQKYKKEDLMEGFFVKIEETPKKTVEELWKNMPQKEEKEEMNDKSSDEKNLLNSFFQEKKDLEKTETEKFTKVDSFFEEMKGDINNEIKNEPLKDKLADFFEQPKEQNKEIKEDKLKSFFEEDKKEILKDELANFFEKQKEILPKESKKDDKLKDFFEEDKDTKDKKLDDFFK